MKGVSDRPLMLVIHIGWLVLTGLWTPMTYGDAITRRFGSPLFIFPIVILTYAIAPLVASCSALGREYWDLLGRGGSARRAAVVLVILGTACGGLLLALRHHLLTS